MLWKFNTALGPGKGVQALHVGSGGAWEPPLVGSDGSVTFGIGNPYQSPAAAIADPSRDLYTDSAVNLDAATGKLRWYFELNAHSGALLWKTPVGEHNGHDNDATLAMSHQLQRHSARPRSPTAWSSPRSSTVS